MGWDLSVSEWEPAGLDFGKAHLCKPVAWDNAKTLLHAYKGCVGVTTVTLHLVEQF